MQADARVWKAGESACTAVFLPPFLHTHLDAQFVRYIGAFTLSAGIIAAMLCLVYLESASGQASSSALIASFFGRHSSR